MTGFNVPSVRTTFPREYYYEFLNNPKCPRFQVTRRDFLERLTFRIHTLQLTTYIIMKSLWYQLVDNCYYCLF